MAAYAHHAMMLGYADEEVNRFFAKALFAVGEDWNMDALLPIEMCIRDSYQNVYFASDGEAGKFTGNIFAYPTTYVVDRSGNIVGEPIVGAITEKKQAETLQKLIDQALAADMG